MTNELEKEYLEDLDHYDEGMGIHSTSYEKCKERLIRLAKIDNSKPSEALECLDKVNNYLNDVYDYKEIKEEVRKDIDTIKQALLRLDRLDAAMELLPNRFSAVNNREIFIMRKEMFEKFQKQEKVLKIIINKKVDFYRLSISNNVNDYNSTIEFNEYKLTEEEFDLLKRYFE